MDLARDRRRTLKEKKRKEKKKKKGKKNKQIITSLQNCSMHLCKQSVHIPIRYILAFGPRSGRIFPFYNEDYTIATVVRL